MADKSLTLVNGAVGSLSIKPTFEGKAVAVAKISIDDAASDLKGLVTIGALTAGAAGVVNIPITAIAAGVQEATVVFKYADAGTNADVEHWGKSTKTIALTINSAGPVMALKDVSTPLTMDLWESKPLTFKVTADGVEVGTFQSIAVGVTQVSLADKFEFTSDEGVYTFKSIQSATDAVVTATAKVTVTGITNDGDEFSLETDVVLNTNINDGAIPTNRFDVEFTE